MRHSSKLDNEATSTEQWKTKSAGNEKRKDQKQLRRWSHNSNIRATSPRRNSEELNMESKGLNKRHSVHRQTAGKNREKKNSTKFETEGSDYKNSTETTNDKKDSPDEGETRKLKPMKLQFWKTKMCPWVSSMGNCRKGASCRYAHAKDELRPLPDLTKTKLCEDFLMNGKCPNPGSCKYAHSVVELRATNSFSKTKICPMWIHGNCVAWPECRFAHGDHELKNGRGEMSDSEQKQSGNKQLDKNVPKVTPEYKKRQDYKTYNDKYGNNKYNHNQSNTGTWNTPRQFHMGRQTSFVDPAVLFQGLSPVSLRVATNALVYLSESQQQGWTTTELTNNQSIPIQSPQQNNRQLMPDQLTYFHQTDPNYSQILYRQSPMNQSPTHWDNGTNYFRPNVPLSPSAGLNIIGRSPMQFYPRNVHNPMSPTSGYSPVHLSALGHTGVETGRYVTTHLLPAGIFSPMSQSSFNPQQDSMERLHQRPVDVIFTYPPDGAQSPIERSDGSLPTSPEQTKVSQQNQQQRDHQSCVANRQYMTTWNTGLQPGSPSLVFPVEHLIRQNNHTTNNLGSPNLFHSALKSPQNSSNNLSTFPSPVIPSSQQTGLYQSGSYTTAVSYTTPTILTTLLPQNEYYGYDRIPGFPVNPIEECPKELESNRKLGDVDGRHKKRFTKEDCSSVATSTGSP